MYVLFIYVEAPERVRAATERLEDVGKETYLYTCVYIYIYIHVLPYIYQYSISLCHMISCNMSYHHIILYGRFP